MLLFPKLEGQCRKSAFQWTGPLTEPARITHGYVSLLRLCLCFSRVQSFPNFFASGRFIQLKANGTLSDQIKDSRIQLILDVVYLLKMLFHCSCILLGVGVQFPIFIHEKLFRYVLLTVSIEPELYAVSTWVLVALTQTFNLVGHP
jgi:hypothetical protein